LGSSVDQREPLALRRRNASLCCRQLAPPRNTRDYQGRVVMVPPPESLFLGIERIGHLPETPAASAGLDQMASCRNIQLKNGAILERTGHRVPSIGYSIPMYFWDYVNKTAQVKAMTRH
jgi:hypothetical protein